MIYKFVGTRTTPSVLVCPELIGSVKATNDQMINRIVNTVLLAIIAAAIAFSALLFSFSEPSTDDLDRDIIQIRERLSKAQAESEKYSGGLIKTLIDLRLETLRLSEEMLAAKRVSILRRINLVFTTENETAQPSSNLQDIESDIRNAERRVAEAEAKSSQYTGGLVQALSLSTLETQRVTVAQLYMTYYAAKYALKIPNWKLKKDQEQPSPGNIVIDKDAL